jgi:hypothetical protein
MEFPDSSVRRIRRIRKFLCLPGPDPLLRGLDPDPSIIRQKYSEKPYFYGKISLKVYILDDAILLWCLLYIVN